MQKNIWSVYYLILVISIIILLGAGYAKHSQLHNDFYSKNEASLKLLSKSIESSLTETELILDILGSRLLENNLYKDAKKTHQLLRQTLKTKPTLAGFGLTDTEGNFIAVSTNLDISLQPNLLLQESSQEGFKTALKSTSAVIDRSYFFPPLNDWVAPIRKALRDSNGKVVAVMNTGIKLKGIAKFTGFTGAENRTLAVINASNYYRVFYSQATPKNYAKVYSKPIPRKIFKMASQSLISNYGVSLTDIKSQMPNQIFSAETKDGYSGEPIIGSVVYNSKYNLFIVLQDPTSNLKKEFFISILIYLFLFLMVHLLLLWFVKRIDKNEKKAHADLLYQAEHDPLTMLYNRNYLEKNFNNQLSETYDDVSLLFIDLDNFKHINNTFGHTTGDKLLKLVAQRLLGFSNYAQQIIRFGGDEFVMVMKGQSHHDFDIAKQIIETLAISYLIDDLNFTIGASIGIAREQGSTCNLNTLLSHADLALYKAKNRKNWVEVFSEELEIQSHKTSSIEHNLRSAIEKNEIYLNYQPQLNNKRELHGVECLVRWQNKELGFVPPDEFIHIAEEMGIMPMLGSHITDMALTEMASLQTRLNTRFHISINVSIKQFMQEQFFEDFIASVENSGIPFKYITIEITESILIEDIDFILSILHQFRRKDIAVSLDDFGTGYSSLSLLRELPIQELKIDKAFVDDILDDSKDATLVKNIINIAKEFDMYTLAEGVETESQLLQLQQFDCDLYQGYYFSKPLSLKDLEMFIRNRNKKNI